MTAAARPGRIPPAALALAVLLYAVQGVVFAFFINFLPRYMSEGGVPENQVRLAKTVAMLPFLVKFLAGPLSDRFPLFGLGHRKPYILIGLLLQGVGLLLLTLVNPGAHLAAFTALAVLTVAGLALYDTCTDGLIVNVTPPEDRPRVQGLLLFARFTSATVFAIGFGYWLGRIGNGPGRGDPILWTCAGLTLLPLVLAVRFSEPPPLAGGEEFSWEAIRVLGRPWSLFLIAFGTFYALMSWSVETNLPYFYQARGFGDAAIGTLGSLRNIGRAIGGLLLPIGLARLGRRWVLRLAVMSLVATEAAQAIPGGPGVAGGLGFLFGLANGWTEAMFYVLAMEGSDPRLAASTYALFMAVTNASLAGEAVFGQAMKLFDNRYEPTFVAAALLTGFAFVLIRPLSRPAPATGPAVPRNPVHAPAP